MSAAADRVLAAAARLVDVQRAVFAPLDITKPSPPGTPAHAVLTEARHELAAAVDAWRAIRARTSPTAGPAFPWEVHVDPGLTIDADAFEGDRGEP